MFHTSSTVPFLTLALVQVIWYFAVTLVQLFSGRIVTAVVVEDYVVIIYNTVLPGSLKPL